MNASVFGSNYSRDGGREGGGEDREDAGGAETLVHSSAGLSELRRGSTSLLEQKMEQARAAAETEALRSKRKPG